MRELLELNGIEYSDQAKEDLLSSYCRILPDMMKKCDSEVLPGVFKLLDSLKDNDNYALGILTGNLRYSANIKLRCLGLDSYFSFGG